MQLPKDSREKLLALSVAVRAAPQSCRIDYRRREDVASGVRVQMEFVWPRIAGWCKKINNDGLTRRQKIEVAIMFLGVVINLATKPDGFWSWSWYWGFGGWLTLAGWLSYMSGIVEQTVIRRDLEHLKEIEREALGRWVGAGAHADYFWSLRDHVVRLAETESNGDFEAGQEAERKLESLWVVIQEAIFCRSSGDPFALDNASVGTEDQA